MADIRRSAAAVWTGTLREGNGSLSTDSGVLDEAYYGFRTRFEDRRGTNPEELIAGAHAGCYNMALANALAQRKHPPERIETRAVCTLSPQPEGGFRITKMTLDVRANVQGIEQAEFLEITRQAEAECPVSNALRGGVEIELRATLA